MKIGILTFANVPNFGANLQAFSTVCYLRNVGLSPVVIKWEPHDFADRFAGIKSLPQPAAHFKFVEEYLPQTRVCRNDREISQVLAEESIEAVIVGSDAVLQHMPFWACVRFPTKKVFSVYHATSERIFPNAFWGTFYPLEKKKIPMAIMSASSQNSKYKFTSKSDKKSMYNCLKRFSYISVRDNWTKRMMEYVSAGEISPQITPDPVFAFNQNCSNWIPCKEEILETFKLPENYVLVSMKSRLLNNIEWMNNLRDAFHEKEMECVALPMPTGVDFLHQFPYEIAPSLSPLHWYALIKYAKGYVGENMHPIVVALANSTPCFCFDTYGYTQFSGMYCKEVSSKIYDIMERFDVMGCRVNATPRFWKIPNVVEIVDKITSFDKEKCAVCANDMLVEYNKMMKNILDGFQVQLS